MAVGLGFSGIIRKIMPSYKVGHIIRLHSFPGILILLRKEEMLLQLELLDSKSLELDPACCQKYAIANTHVVF